MQIVRALVENPDELLNSSAFGTGAKVRLESSSDGTTYAEESTQTIVTATTIYTFYDTDGTSATYYRIRYSNTGGTVFSDYSDVFQVVSAPVEYATLHSVKNRLAITNTSDDSVIEQIVNESNDWLEGRIGFSVGPIASELRLFDGDRVRNGILPVYPWGVRTVSAVRTADSTGGSYTSRTASDVVVRPHSHERTSGWPGFELWVKDTASWSFPTAGLDVIEITATWGWATVPRELVSIATRVAIAAFKGRSHGTGAVYMVGGDVDGIAAEEMTATDWKTIGKYANLKAMVG